MATTNLTLSDVFTPATQPQWLSALQGALQTLNLPATQWQSGGVARTIVALMSQTLANEDGLFTVANQGGFLDFAATGTVTYNTTSGSTVTVPVTVDPSTLTGSALAAWLPGWLDILADGSYNVQRIQLTAATGPIALTNTTAVSVGPFAPGTYHIANPATGATYSNVSALTIAAQTLVGNGVLTASATTPVNVTTNAAHGLVTGQTVTTTGIGGVTGANGTFVVTVLSATQFTLVGSTGSGGYTSGGTVNLCTVGSFAADVAGAGSTSATGTITQTVTSVIGVSCYNTSPLTGTNWQSNTSLAAACRLKLQSLTPNGAAGAYQFFALQAATILAAQTQPAVLTGGAITRASVAAIGGGAVTTTIANAGATTVTGATGLAVTAAVASPTTPLIRLTIPSTTGLTGYVVVSGVGGVPNANGTWLFNIINGTQIDLVGSVFGGSFTSNGTLSWGDLGLVDSVIQANCVPAGTTAITQAATPFTVTVSATVYVPAAQVTAYTAAANAALATYFSTLPIGGLNTDGGTNLVPIGAIQGVLFQAGVLAGNASYVRGITTVLLNGSGTDVSLTSSQVAALGTVTLNVVGQ